MARSKKIISNAPHPQVDAFLLRSGTWQTCFIALREILSAFELEEQFKWGVPCYTLNGKNVILMHGFKNYCALLFVKGALLKDPHQLLVIQTENTQSARQIRFTDARQVNRLKTKLEAYIRQAIVLEASGEQVAFKSTAEFPFPEELKIILDQDPGLRAAFESLTPGRQRGYLLHFSGAKQSQTRTNRILQAIPAILSGKGLRD